MEENKRMNPIGLASQLLGGNGSDMMGMMDRMSRLSRLVGSGQSTQEHGNGQSSSGQVASRQVASMQAAMQAVSGLSGMGQKQHSLDQNIVKQSSVGQGQSSQASSGYSPLEQSPLEEMEKGPAENMLFALLPFFDGGQQKNMFMLSKIMELQRIMTKKNDGELLYAREKEENPVLRRNKMLEAVKPYLPVEERQQLDMMQKIMQMRELLEVKEEL